MKLVYKPTWHLAMEAQCPSMSALGSRQRVSTSKNHFGCVLHEHLLHLLTKLVDYAHSLEKPFWASTAWAELKEAIANSGWGGGQNMMQAKEGQTYNTT